jgi:hypothetical protein
MTPDDWFAELAAVLGAATPTVTEDERDALLDLARVAAHTSERWTAPISTFLAGVVLTELPASERSTRLRELVAGLEPPTAPVT